MDPFNCDELNYYILDPTGNITALVESEVDISLQPKAAEMIMKRHPEVEQVGFVRYGGNGGPDVSLRMAGGEFCGNASICAAALFLLRNQEQEGADRNDSKHSVCLSVSGIQMEVQLTETGENSFYARIEMPEALSIEETFIGYGSENVPVPIIRMEGISHILIEKESPLFALKNDPYAAEEQLRLAGADPSCLGFLFLEENENNMRLTPLVFVPGSDTMFWENSCASGSAAAGMYFASKKNAPVDMTMDEPGGSLRVVSRPGGTTYLYGGVQLCSPGESLEFKC